MTGTRNTTRSTTETTTKTTTTTDDETRTETLQATEAAAGRTKAGTSDTNTTTGQDGTTATTGPNGAAGAATAATDAAPTDPAATDPAATAGTPTAAGPCPGGTGGLRALVVDDEAPARADLQWLLEREPAIGSVAVAGDATEALRLLQGQDIDVVFLDIRMPGLHGLDLARVLGRFAAPPDVVFVTAHEDHAVEAFELRACDYLLKPVRAERLHEALTRVRPRLGPVERPAPPPATAATGATTATAATPTPAAPAPAAAGRAPEPPVDPYAVLTVELGGRTRFVARDDVRYAAASGDYARLHTVDEAHLVRVPLSVLEARWASAGFFRIHRGYLVSLRAVTELRSITGKGTVVVVDGHELPVSRRLARGLKEALLHTRAAETARPR